MLNSRFPSGMRAMPKTLWFAVLSLATAIACSGGSSMPTPSAIPVTSSAGPSPSSTPSSPGVSDWRETEYAKISRLRGGMTLDYFRDVLGTPMFVSKSTDGRFTQSLFQGRQYWVQAVTDALGSVDVMAVSSCDLDFRPRFEEPVGGIQDPSGATHPLLNPIVLNETHLDQVGAEPPSKLHYWFSGATANSYFYDEYSFGNPGNYKTYFVGIDDACPPVPAPDVLQRLVGTDYRDKDFDAGDDAVNKFRASAIANTYSETGPFADPDAVTAFQIGADRILTRTAPPFPQ